MERAILKTLIYADIFDYPLTLREIHKWLINKKADLRQIEKKLYKVSGIKYKGKFYFLSESEKKRSEASHFLKNRNNIVRKRLQREKQSKIYFRKARIIAQILKIIPWIKLVGISGGLAMEHAGKKDDIDLFVITAKNRLWISRFLALGLLSLVGQRRKRDDLLSKAVGKLCINTLLEEDCLEQSSKDIYLAHEVLQMKVLWQRDGVYQKYLEDNSWAFRFLPNWINQYSVSGIKYKGNKKPHYTLYTILYTIVDYLENLAKKFQLRIMKPKQGMERIEDGALYFHPKDCRKEILAKFKLKIAPLDK